MFKATLMSLLPESMQNMVREQRKRFGRHPPVGWVRFGSLRRLDPIARWWGFRQEGIDKCIDRYYIEKFLAQHQEDIGGRVLEIEDDNYTQRYGGDRVTKSDILDVDGENPKATIIADLARGENIESGTFDCIILTQTLQCIFDLRAAIATLHRILKPAGVVLATLPGISQMPRSEGREWGEYWRFTSRAAHEVFCEAFPEEGVMVQAHGNVLTCVALLEGMVLDDLNPDALEYDDPDYEMLLTVRAQKETLPTNAR